MIFDGMGLKHQNPCDVTDLGDFFFVFCSFNFLFEKVNQTLERVFYQDIQNLEFCPKQTLLRFALSTLFSVLDKTLFFVFDYPLVGHFYAHYNIATRSNFAK